MRGVSRETRERLEDFVELVSRWNKTINLVSPHDVPQIWDRHVADSVQIAQSIDGEMDVWTDLGSGGGFPGLIVAIVTPDRFARLNLVEADRRKATFLRTAVRELSLQATVHAARIEDVSLPPADVISARALASLDRLLGMAHRLAKPTATHVFPKGVTWRTEVDEALERWSFHYETIPSALRAGSVILKVRDVAPLRS